MGWKRVDEERRRRSVLNDERPTAGSEANLFASEPLSPVLGRPAEQGKDGRCLLVFDLHTPLPYFQHVYRFVLGGEARAEKEKLDV